MNWRYIAFIASACTFIASVAYLDVTTCWSCYYLPTAAEFGFAAASIIGVISFVASLIYGAVSLHYFVRTKKLRKPGLMTLSASGFDYQTYVSVVRNRLTADGFDVDERIAASGMETAGSREPSPNGEGSHLRLGLFASKKGGRNRGPTFCALVDAEDVTVELIDQAIVVVRQLAIAQTKIANETARTFFVVIISSLLSGEVVEYVENRKTVEVAMVGVERRGVRALLLPNPMGSRGMYLVTVPVLVEVKTGKVFFNQKVARLAFASAVFQSRVRDRVREYFFVNGVR